MKDQTQPDLSGIHLWLVLWKAAHAVEAHSTRSVERFEMSPTDFGVLEALLHKGPLTVTQLGEKVLLTSGSMTTAIDRLEKRSLVTRCDDANDRRARIIKLTPQGRALIKKVFTQHENAMEQAIDGFTPQERAALLPLLRKLGKTAQQNF
jgi:MarR family transcriptional regulator, 2-MHQ and catechol-resistance regulon repressor